jgi:DHA1 family bicyclomycin/chloramphenicol resistance-like MFS transporter
MDDDRRGREAVSPSAAPAPPLWLPALFAFTGTFAMHIFVPALTLAAADLSAGIAAVQLTVSLYILGLAAGQLVYGPISDRFGRRPLLMAGLALYTAAGLAAAIAPSIEALVAARLFQALGGCAGLVLGRTIVRDTASPEDTARRLALMNLMMTVGPAVAPIAGAGLAAAFGWRAIFEVLSLLGLLNLILAWRLLPETRPPGTGAGGAFLRHAAGLLRNRAFLGFAIGGGCATTAMYAFVASAPFIFVHALGRPPHEAGIYLAVLVSGVWLGSALASRLIARAALPRLLLRANLVSVLAACLLLAAALTGQLSVALTVGAMFAYTVGVGIAAPASLTQAMGVDPRVIGSASGLYGCTQMAVGALCTALAGIGGDPAIAAPAILVGAGILGQAAFRMALGKAAKG